MSNPVARGPKVGFNVPALVDSRPQTASGAVWFTYFGAGTLTVVGPITQRRYIFPSYGARLAVDPRDRLSLRSVPHLRESR